jgi:hypothetical protein
VQAAIQAAVAARATAVRIEQAPVEQFDWGFSFGNFCFTPDATSSISSLFRSQNSPLKFLQPKAKFHQAKLLSSPSGLFHKEVRIVRESRMIPSFVKCNQQFNLYFLVGD